MDLIDYDREGDSLLISSGSGIMVAVMDALPHVRWCIDVDTAGCDHRLFDVVQWSRAACAARILIVGWFSITSPEPLRRLVSAIDGEALAYTPGVDLGAHQCSSLAEFLREASL